MRRLVAFVWLALIWADPAAARTQQTPTTIPEMWNAWCARCHGRDGTGKVAQPTVAVQPMDFTNCRLTTGEADADWTLAISKGGPAVGLSSQMPAFGEVISAEQVAGFVKHVRGFCKERGWPSGNFNLPRAIFAEKAFPEDELVIVPMASHNPNEFTTYQVRTIFERRIGRRAQLEAVLPFESVYLGTRETGVGDVEIGGKYALTPYAKRFLLTSGFDVSLGTGQSSQIAGGFGATLEPYLAAATTLGSSYLQGQFKMEFPTTGSWKNRETIFHVYMGRDTSLSPDTWTIGIELSGENKEFGLTPQIRKGLTRTGALGAAVGARIPLTEREEQGITWIGYLVWEFLEPVRPRR